MGPKVTREVFFLFSGDDFVKGGRGKPYLNEKEED